MQAAIRAIHRVRQSRRSTATQGATPFGIVIEQGAAVVHCPDELFVNSILTDVPDGSSGNRITLCTCEWRRRSQTTDSHTFGNSAACALQSVLEVGVRSWNMRPESKSDMSRSSILSVPAETVDSRRPPEAARLQASAKTNIAMTPGHGAYH